MTEQQVESLIEKFAGGTATEEEIQQLTQWYRSYPIADVSWTASSENGKALLKDRILKRLQSEIKPQNARVITMRWLKVAAAALILVTGIAMTYYLGFDNRKSFVTIKNPSGKIQLVVLPDSSHVWLNAASTLAYNEAFNINREIQLNGEAFFQVTHDASHPFTVEAGGIKTTVLGTSFDIKAYDTDSSTKVALITGRVSVQEGNTRLAVLAPAQELDFDRSKHIGSVSASDTSNVLAWQKGELRFSGQSLAEVAATLERWYGIDIQFANPGMTSCRYYMSFDNTISLTGLLSAMAQITDMKYTIDNSLHTVTLSGNACH